MSLCLLFSASLTSSATAQGIQIVRLEHVRSVPYAFLRPYLAGQIDFETYPVLPEPGSSFETALSAPGVTIGEHLVGQIVTKTDSYDALTGAVQAPPKVISGKPGENLAVAYHAGFGSNALFPLGPDGFGARSGRGEGAVAFVFEAAIDRLALKLHADYADPLGARPTPGAITIRFYDVGGGMIALAKVIPHHGVTPVAFELMHKARAVTITHTDPGGIAIDDILYPLENYGS